MSRCECCDVLLSNEETRIRLKSSGEFANTCRVCLDSADILYTMPRPSWEEDVIVDPEPTEEDNFFSQEYWDER